MPSLFQMTDNFKANPDNNPQAQSFGNTLGKAFGGGQVGDMIGGVVGNSLNGVMKFITNPASALQDMKNFANGVQPSPQANAPVTPSTTPAVVDTMIPKFNKDYWGGLTAQQPEQYRDVSGLFAKQGMGGMINLSQPMQNFLNNRVKPVNYNPFKINPWNG